MSQPRGSTGGVVHTNNLLPLLNVPASDLGIFAYTNHQHVVTWRKA